MLYPRPVSLISTFLFIVATTLLLAACESNNDINIPDRNSLGISQPLIEIYAPSSNDSLPADTPFIIDYAVLRSKDGHHVDFRIDNKKPVSVFKRQGKHRIQGLPAGKHRIQLTEYTRDGRLTGGMITLHLTMSDEDKAITQESQADSYSP